MINPQIVEYIKNETARGVSRELIHGALVNTGWPTPDVDASFASLDPATNGAQSFIPVKYAGFWIRFVALMVDSAILYIPYVVVPALIVISSDFPMSDYSSVAFVLLTITSCLYFILMTHYGGATLGKMLVGITVRGEDAQSLSLAMTAVRETLAKFLSGIILFVGYMMAGWTGKKQALHDKLVGSVVVYKDPAGPKWGRVFAGILLAMIVMFILPSFVVVTSLNSAREKAADAQVRYEEENAARQEALRLDSEFRGAGTNMQVEPPAELPVEPTIQ